MKNSVLLPAIIGLLCLAACRKESSRLTGRWQKVKLRVYNQNASTGVITRDTTSANFGPLDYAEFSGDNNCTVSTNILLPGSTPPNWQLSKNTLVPARKKDMRWPQPISIQAALTYCLQWTL